MIPDFHFQVGPRRRRGRLNRRCLRGLFIHIFAGHVWVGTQPPDSKRAMGADDLGFRTRPWIHQQLFDGSRDMPRSVAFCDDE